MALFIDCSLTFPSSSMNSTMKVEDLMDGADERQHDRAMSVKSDASLNTTMPFTDRDPPEQHQRRQHQFSVSSPRDTDVTTPVTSGRSQKQQQMMMTSTLKSQSSEGGRDGGGVADELRGIVRGELRKIMEVRLFNLFY